MKSILEDFKNGSARERLGIASDLLSVVGISFVAALAPVLHSEGKLTPSRVAEGVMIGLASLAGLSLGLAATLVLDAWLKRRLPPGLIRALILIAFWCLPIGALVYAVTIFYYSFIYVY